MQNPPTRTLNGVGHVPAAKRPLPTRGRRPGLIAAAVALVVGFALTGAMLVSDAGGKTDVLVAAGPMAAGQVLGADDVRSASVAGDVRAIADGDLPTVLGRTAAVDLVEGQLLNRDMLTAATVPPAGQALVGLALAPGRLPGEVLATGDRVQALAVPSAGAAVEDVEDPRVVATGEVFAIQVDPAAAGSSLVTVLVPAESAGALAAYAATGQVSLVKVAAPVQTAGQSAGAGS